VSVAPITFLAPYGLCMLLLAANPFLRHREIAAALGVTQRYCEKVLANLLATGYLSLTHVGRRNLYEVRGDMPLMFPGEGTVTVATMLAALRQ